MKMFFSIFLFLIALPLICFGQESGKYWIYFTDKEPVSLHKMQAGEFHRTILSDRAIKRRLKVRTEANLIDKSDLPVSLQYLEALKQLEVHPKRISKWLNAVSAYLTEEQVRAAKQFNFVRSVKPITIYTGSPAPQTLQPQPLRKQSAGQDVYRYGESFAQNAQINAHLVHNLGITGKKVLIGMFDTGFNRDHEALEDIQVTEEYDFIQDDGNTANQQGDNLSQHTHGTFTLGAIGGFKETSPGENSPGLIGTAFGAAFVLGKTENVTNETRIEEDDWVAGLEWMDSLGVDLVSSSLGYADGHNNPVEDYTVLQMDGKTAITTIVANMAVEKGITIVNAAGNERTSTWGDAARAAGVGALISPADGFDVITVGAVYSTGFIAPFSSFGPTADGRIKPDVSAMGVNVHTASSGNRTSYSSVNGTSLSCPLTAGVAALVLSAHPELTPRQVKEALAMTADRAETPDNDYGYGIIDALAAVTYFGGVFSDEPDLALSKTGYNVTIGAASTDGVKDEQLTLTHSEAGGSDSASVILTPDSIAGLYSGSFTAASQAESLWFCVTFTDSAAKVWRSDKWMFLSGDPSTKWIITSIENKESQTEESAIPRQFMLYQNYPNPFNPVTTIRIDVPISSDLQVVIYDILGREIRTLVNRRVQPGNHRFEWNGLNAGGRSVASGIYFYSAVAGEFRQVRKMVLMK